MLHSLISVVQGRAGRCATAVALALMLLEVGVRAFLWVPTAAAQPERNSEVSSTPAAAEGLTARAIGEPAENELVIPSGQEELLADMLGRGATLPGGCKFAGGHADGPKISATYSCLNGDVVFELLHPSKAPAGAIETSKFAIVLRSGSPPGELIASLATRIRARESDFQWKWAAPVRFGYAALPTPLLLALAGAGLLALAALWWVARARSAAPRT